MSKEEKQTYYLTFGCKYPWRNGWVEVSAPDLETARVLVLDIFGDKYANLYTEETFKEEFFPAGKIGETIE